MQSTLWKWFPGFLENLGPCPSLLPCSLGEAQAGASTTLGTGSNYALAPGTAVLFTFRERVWVPLRQWLTPHRGT